jgi:hypothetical protein
MPLVKKIANVNGVNSLNLVTLVLTNSFNGHWSQDDQMSL